MRSSWTLAVVGASVLVGLSSPVHGTGSVPSLSAPSTDVTFGGTSYPDAGAGVYTTPYSIVTPNNIYENTAGTMSATIQYGPYPLVSLDVSGCCGLNTYGQGRAELIYYAELTGPNFGPVPLDLFENLTSSSTGPRAGGWAEIEADGITTAQEIVWSNGSDTIDGNATGSVPGLLRFDAAPGGRITVDMTVTASAADGEGWSSADPYLTIDPSFAAVDPNYASDYSLSFSPGIVNASAPVSDVPEPATWEMMLLGFGMTGLAMRSRRIRAAFQRV